MAQVIPNLGPLAGIGQGLSQGLQTLAERKLAQLDASEKRSALQNALKQTGRYSDADINILSALPEKDLYNALTTYNPSGQTQNQPQQQGLQGPNQPLDLAKLNATDLIAQFKNMGAELTPEQEQKIAQKFESLKSNPALLQQIQSQMAGPQQQPQEQQALQPLFKKPLTEGEKIAKEGLELKKKKDEREAYKEIKPFLDEQAKDFKNATEIYKLASRALKNIESHKDKWPKLGGYLPPSLLRDPDVRDYVRDVNNIVNIKANSLRGNPTNFKTKLIQEGKIDLTQPIESQINGLKQLIADSKEVFDTQDIISSMRKEGYSQDISQQLIERIGRPDQRESSSGQGQTLASVDRSSLQVGQPLRGKDGKRYVWDGSKPVLAE